MISFSDIEKLKRLHYEYGHFLICIDLGKVTDEKAKEERFDRMEAKFEKMLEGSGISVVVFDRTLKPPERATKGIEPGMMGTNHLPWYPLIFIDENKKEVTEKFCDMNLVECFGGIIGEGQKIN